MKNIFIILMIIGLSLTSCSDDDKLPVDFDDLINSGLPFASLLDFESEFKPIEGELFITQEDPNSYDISLTFEMNSPLDGSDVTAIKILGSFKDNTKQGNIDISASDVLLAEIPSSQFSSSGGLPEVTFDITGTELLQAFGFATNQIEGLDVFTYQVVLVTDKGEFTDVSANFDNQSADHTFNAQVLCLSDFNAEFTYVSTSLSTPEVDAPSGGWPDQTGSGQFTEIREGVYQITPGVTFGAWPLWYSGARQEPTTVLLRDNCEIFSFIGEDENEDGYKISPFIINGNELTFTWENDEEETGTVTLTRTDGMDWPIID